MATRRGASVPLGGGGNAFWSERTREEWNLMRQRPQDLPVPGDDEEISRELDGEFPAVMGEEQVSRGRRPASPRQGERQQGSQQRERLLEFRTPSSWEPRVNAKDGKGTGSGSTALGKQSEGLMPEEQEEDEGERARRELAFQRELEKEVVNQLHEENMKLKQQVELLIQNKDVKPPSTSDWSQVSQGTGFEDVEMGQTMNSTPKKWVVEDRFTPNGTKVPPLPPPRSEIEVPPWPLERYEQQEREVGRWLNSMGPIYCEVWKRTISSWC